MAYVDDIHRYRFVCIAVCLWVKCVGLTRGRSAQHMSSRSQRDSWRSRYCTSVSKQRSQGAIMINLSVSCTDLLCFFFQRKPRVGGKSSSTEMHFFQSYRHWEFTGSWFALEGQVKRLEIEINANGPWHLFSFCATHKMVECSVAIGKNGPKAISFLFSYCYCFWIHCEA